MVGDPEALLRRAHVSPGLPVPSPTHPYWQDDPPFPALVDIQSGVLPQTADIVIIGSGITAAAVTRAVLHEHRRKSQAAGGGQETCPHIVVLEARQLCSGATSRNGGHIKAVPHEILPRLLKAGIPVDRAVAIVRFQLRHLDVLTHLCQTEGIDAAECREVETVDLFTHGEAFEKAKEQVTELSALMPDVVPSVWSAQQAREKFGANNLVVGAISYRAGAWWPYRFVSTIWKRLLDDCPGSISIETSTPATAIDSDPKAAPEPGNHPFNVTTPRGTVRARHVVHASNAFVSHLIPGLRGRVTGALVHMSAQRPGIDFPGNADGGLRSWSLMHELGFDYAIQRPSSPGSTAPGDVMLGGGFAQSPAHGADCMGVYDDSRLEPLTVAHVLGVMPTVFEPRWGPPAAGGSDRKRMWSGLIALSPDWRPLVGRVDPRITGRTPKRKQDEAKPPLRDSQDDQHGLRNQQPEPGEWIAAMYNGDGMVWAWLTGTALGHMLMGTDGEDLPAAPGRPAGRVSEWLPSEMLSTWERLSNLDIRELGELV